MSVNHGSGGAAANTHHHHRHNLHQQHQSNYSPIPTTIGSDRLFQEGISTSLAGGVGGVGAERVGSSLGGEEDRLYGRPISRRRARTRRIRRWRPHPESSRPCILAMDVGVARLLGKVVDGLGGRGSPAELDVEVAPSLNERRRWEREGVGGATVSESVRSPMEENRLISGGAVMAETLG
ncbi:unnamed protein product [Linum trigynum]|uniref:Uncharacterized protein n=1 Tax=Linum trigynum TaxID=586398 RepID=A0AAV2FJS1_9ROSI